MSYSKEEGRLMELHVALFSPEVALTLPQCVSNVCVTNNALPARVIMCIYINNVITCNNVYIH